MTDLTTTLADRKKSHGNFADNAVVIQNLKRVMRDTENWGSLSSSQREALEMIQHKIGRILSGNANHIDSWHDISGYATLEENILIANQEINKPLPIRLSPHSDNSKPLAECMDKDMK